VTDVPVAAESVPQPLAGLKLQVSPPLAGSFARVADTSSVDPPAMADNCLLPESTTEIGLTVTSTDADLEESAVEATATVAVHAVVSDDDAGAV